MNEHSDVPCGKVSPQVDFLKAGTGRSRQAAHAIRGEDEHNKSVCRLTHAQTAICTRAEA